MSPKAPGSVTRWIDGLKLGDDEAARRLWDRYFSSLVRLARKRLGEVPRGQTDEEDIALVAFHRLCMGAARGRYPKLNDRDDLWRLLATITRHAASDQRRYLSQSKRAGVPIAPETSSPGAPAFEDEAGLGFVVGREPSPEFAAMMAEQCEKLLGRLDDALCQIAIWKLEGNTNVEIAARIGCTVTTVQRKLTIIRRIWTDEERR